MPIAKLTRSPKLGIPGLRKYLKGIVGEYVEKPGKVRVTSADNPRTVRYTVSVDEADLPRLEADHEGTVGALTHIMNQVTRAHYGKPGRVSSKFEVTK